ncbi:dipeptidase [Alicyclobacillus sp. SO9]|uniref:dipeptidase n=1 Tax=Alicyclobacillus sp. SO9 TaxID=2665646 RepID=UPI001E3677B8|nr:dipeptidase [Alicyclobacillus sp. SO9]
MTQSFDTYFEQQRDKHLRELFEFLRFPSISTQPEHAQDVAACAEFLSDKMRNIGFENVSLMPTKGHPVVYGDWLHAEGKPTVLVYGHYDVQPVDPVELWDSAPFEPEIRDGKLYARGASDDKGQVFMHLKAFEALFETNGELPVNVKFCFEGEEEIGSLNLPEFVRQHQELLAADIVVISDTTMLGPDMPSICYGLRGLAGLQVDVKGAKGDLHSGLYGGAIQNPLHALVHILDSMHNDDGSVAVEGFYNSVTDLTPDERSAYATLGSNDAELMKELDVPALYGEAGYTPRERIWGRPTLEINGVYGGYQGEGTKTVIPSEAHAKITCRLVPAQDPDDILDKVEAHVQKHTRPGVKSTVIKTDRGNAYLTPFNHPAIQLAAESYAKAYGKPASFSRMGGSIPVVDTFSSVLNTPVVLMGFGLESENFHAPNEHFTLSNFDRGLRTLCYYWLGLEDALR